MKRSTPLQHLALCLATLLTLTAAAQPKKEQSLLWRITGNGLVKPSWLYGTIHLTDKQVFNFGDSLYAALERCEGYAMEVSPDSIMNKALKELKDDNNYLKGAVSAADFNRMRKKLQAQFKKDPEQVTVKEFKRHFLTTLNKVDKNAMHTIMDAWFYDAMRRQGKWVGGVEDLADQDGMEEISALKDYVDDFMDDNRKSRQTLSKMIELYKNQDLQGVAEFEEGKEFFLDSIMLRRNKKMARRMDSLAHIRSTFFAVGAGHLPGDSGVIMHLRSRGFTVEVIQSSRTIHATAYHFEEKELPWKNVEAGNGLFRVQMPGEPQDMGLADENMDMKMYADIGANLIYVAISTSRADKFGIDSMISLSIKNIARRAKVQSVTPIKKDSVEGREVIARGDDAIYRMQCYYRSPVVYLVMVASPIDSITRSKDAERFLKSLVMLNKPQSDYIPWSEYKSEKQAFSVRFPYKPTVKTQPNEGGNTFSVNHSSLDVGNDIYFQVLVEDMKKGYFLVSDTASFDNYKEYLAKSEDCKVISHQYDSRKGYPVMWSVFMRKNNYGNFYNKVMSLHRGNRIYHAIVTASDSSKNRNLLNDFFNSFTMVPVNPGKWETYQAPDRSFSVWSATPVNRYIDSTSEEKDGLPLYEIYDPSSPCTYFLRKEAYNPYFWTTSDTALLLRMVKNIVKQDETVLSYEPVSNGPYKGVEVLVGLPDNHNLQKMRILLVGDSLFTLYGMNAREMLDMENSRRIFTDFTVAHNTPGTIYTSKAAALFKALESTDSAAFATAKAGLDQVVFSKDELPLLHDAFGKEYRDSAEYENVARKVKGELETLKDESTLAFVRQSWATLPIEREYLRYDLLDLLAQFHTKESTTLARDLIMQKAPTAGDPFYFFDVLADSMALTAPLMPSFMPLLKDSLAGPHLVTLIEALLDSNRIDLQSLTAWKPDIYKLANATIQQAKANDELNWLTDPPMIRLLSKLKDPAANQWIRKFLAQPDMNMKYLAASALLKSGQSVPAAELLKLAADPGQRNDLYELLKEVKKASLFPAQYRTQKAFAEAALYEAATEDADDAKLVYIGERTVVTKGVRQKYYLFKVLIGGGEEDVAYLGIAGPYTVQPGKLVTSSDNGGIYWENEYKAATVDRDFKAYLKAMEEQEEQQKQ